MQYKAFFFHASPSISRKDRQTDRQDPCSGQSSQPGDADDETIPDPRHHSRLSIMACVTSFSFCLAASTSFEEGGRPVRLPSNGVFSFLACKSSL